MAFSVTTLFKRLIMAAAPATIGANPLCTTGDALHFSVATLKRYFFLPCGKARTVVANTCPFGPFEVISQTEPRHRTQNDPDFVARIAETRRSSSS
jgi:hypothetical protein